MDNHLLSLRRGAGTIIGNEAETGNHTWKHLRHPGRDRGRPLDYRFRVAGKYQYLYRFCDTGKLGPQQLKYPANIPLRPRPKKNTQLTLQI
jgi:hypothetical protein